MRKLSILVLLNFSLLAIAQNQIPELITDRPDQTESSAVVPRKLLQIETGFVMEKRQTELSEEKLDAYNTSLLRYGLLDNLELRLGLEYLGEKASIKNIDTSYNFSGLSPIYMGLKIKIME